MLLLQTELLVLRHLIILLLLLRFLLLLLLLLNHICRVPSNSGALGRAHIIPRIDKCLLVRAAPRWMAQDHGGTLGGRQLDRSVVDHVMRKVHGEARIGALVVGLRVAHPHGSQRLEKERTGDAQVGRLLAHVLDLVQ